jgi:hypothetical protein
VQLADKLKIFKTDNFDPDAYVQSKCQTMNEKVSLPACLPSLIWPRCEVQLAVSILLRVGWTAGVAEKVSFRFSWRGLYWTRRM